MITKSLKKRMKHFFLPSYEYRVVELLESFDKPPCVKYALRKYWEWLGVTWEGALLKSSVADYVIMFDSPSIANDYETTLNYYGWYSHKIDHTGDSL